LNYVGIAVTEQQPFGGTTNLCDAIQNISRDFIGTIDNDRTRAELQQQYNRAIEYFRDAVVPVTTGHIVTNTTPNQNGDLFTTDPFAENDLQNLWESIEAAGLVPTSPIFTIGHTEPVGTTTGPMTITINGDTSTGYQWSYNPTSSGDWYTLPTTDPYAGIDIDWETRRESQSSPYQLTCWTNKDILSALYRECNFVGNDNKFGLSLEIEKVAYWIPNPTQVRNLIKYLFQKYGKPLDLVVKGNGLSTPITWNSEAFGLSQTSRGNIEEALLSVVVAICLLKGYQ